MSNISFDNPWLLFIALPLIAVVLVPFFITVKRDNANFHNITSVSLHIVICICITLAISGMAFEKVVTDTQVYVLADISYSAEHNIEDVQEKVEGVAKRLPKNSKMGVICFARNYQLLSELGESVPDISKADKVDRSATDIGSALRYAGNIFDDGVIKRIVVVTDGVETVSSNNIVKVISALNDGGVYVDAVYVDDNMTEDARELQIDSAEATQSTYLNKEEEVSVLIRANCGVDADGKALERTDGYVTLYKNGVLAEKKPVSFYSGLNVVTLPLYTDEEGTFDYELKVEAAEPDGDFSPYNNVCYFTQKVTNERKVLFLGGSAADLAAGKRIYGEKDVSYISDVKQVPVTVEDMCGYDEIVLSNFDVRTVRASNAFMTSLTTLVNDYGKTLTTYGNTFIQEDDPDEANSVLKRLSDLLPVRVGNYDQYKRLVAIVLDISLSMDFSSRMSVAKRAAVELLNVLNNSDTVMVVGFSRVIDEFMPATQLTARKVVIEKIDAKQPENGTSLAGALEHTYSKLPTRYQDRQVIVISDGLCSAADKSAAKARTVEMCRERITVSALGIYPQAEDGAFLSEMIYNGNESGDAFYKNIKHESEIDVIMKDIGEEQKQVRIDEPDKLYGVSVRKPDDAVVHGVGDLGAVDGFWYNAAKTKSTVVLTAKYYRDNITSFDVPLYAYWNGGGRGMVVSFMSDIASDWAGGWSAGTEGGKFLANIPDATLPSERVTTPFIVEVSGKGNAASVSVQTPTSLLSSTYFKATLTDPNGLVTEKTLAYDSSEYFASFATDAPGVYRLHLVYERNGLVYEADKEFSVSYYAEYDSFTTYSRSYLYRLLSSNGRILELDEIDKLENTDSEYSTFTFSFTLPLMIVCAVLLMADIIIRQLKWKDVTSFFGGIFRRRK